ncbi:LysE/ArgO family amino acid transporter [Paraferrimonas sedimenticola]|uniref:Amino acid transporter n=1 Tax=Paraferrimonas sedimenticola TaxID=375674 RepID=A0AA37VWF0_9GAMM|nr:LysE/ArgO family amino acid transporter [Paraferrimonas sedimenticola]GLP94765.1 amino acid transporter [Paraferrimonas sedimenticola]
MAAAFVQGMGIGASLIIAVGAQNAFVLKQGIKRNYPMPIAMLCSLIDALMITAGVMGMGQLIMNFPTLAHAASFGGAAFLFWYGFNALKSSFNPQAMNTNGGQAADSLKKAILTTLAISLLNPHLYLDTVVLLGSISTQYAVDDRPLFGAGAVFASFLWFFALSYGSRFLAPVFQNPKAWVYLDRFIFLTMWGIAFAILSPYIKMLLN